MARTSRRTQALALLFLAPIVANAQVLSNLPTLGATSTQTGKSTQTASGNTKTNTNTAATSSSTSTFALTGAPTLTTSAGSIFHLTGLPTIAGAGIPTLVIPYTANAPYMQKSSLPEGTFFIAVGATLAFFGACVLLWRAMVAWSTNRSVKRTALASIGAGRSEKSGSSGPWNSSSHRKSTGYQQVSKSGVYTSDSGYGAGSTMSLDHLTSAGKLDKPHSRGSHQPERQSTAPSSLFFSPTAQARESGTWSTHNNRTSAYMPSGYYASPSGAPPASATVGGNGSRHSVAPYAQHQRHSTLSRVSGLSDPSPPPSPGLGAHRDSRSRDYNLGSRDGGLRPPSHLYAQPSTSSLMVGQSSYSDLATTANNSRPNSAVLEDMFSQPPVERRER